MYGQRRPRAWRAQRPQWCCSASDATDGLLRAAGMRAELHKEAAEIEAAMVTVAKEADTQQESNAHHAQQEAVEVQAAASQSFAEIQVADEEAMLQMALALSLKEHEHTIAQQQLLRKQAAAAKAAEVELELETVAKQEEAAALAAEETRLRKAARAKTRQQEKRRAREEAREIKAAEVAMANEEVAVAKEAEAVLVVHSQTGNSSHAHQPSMMSTSVLPTSNRGCGQVIATIIDLVRRPELNGRTVSVMHFADDSARWAVQCKFSGEEILVREANLKVSFKETLSTHLTPVPCGTLERQLVSRQFEAAIEQSLSERGDTGGRTGGRSFNIPRSVRHVRDLAGIHEPSGFGDKQLNLLWEFLSCTKQVPTDKHIVESRELAMALTMDGKLTMSAPLIACAYECGHGQNETDYMNEWVSNQTEPPITVRRVELFLLLHELVDCSGYTTKSGRVGLSLVDLWDWYAYDSVDDLKLIVRGMHEHATVTQKPALPPWVYKSGCDPPVDVKREGFWATVEQHKTTWVYVTGSGRALRPFEYKQMSEAEREHLKYALLSNELVAAHGAIFSIVDQQNMGFMMTLHGEYLPDHMYEDDNLKKLPWHVTRSFTPMHMPQRAFTNPELIYDGAISAMETVAATDASKFSYYPDAMATDESELNPILSPENLTNPALGCRRRCAACHKPTRAFECSRCLMTYYCSKACQRSHWKVHKGLCRRVSEASDEVKETLKRALKAHGRIAPKVRKPASATPVSTPWGWMEILSRPDAGPF